MRKVLILMVVSLCLSGCQLQARDGYEPQAEDKNGSRLMKTGYGDYEEIESDEDEQFTENPGPNFLDLTESRPDQGNDQNKLEEAIRNDKTLSLGRVIINGDTIHVNVFTTEKLNADEMKKKEKEVHDNMITALPRYRIDVNLKEKNSEGR
ncbi:hypothetical protein [Metabacillus niabensis]|uniref:hypothetical protein n=1 Tax=Metabacillus niabensis TaxID=324854 RepID=UPI001CFA2E95|nr:hypothetical protein [Metabacillus niabensis]